MTSHIPEVKKIEKLAGQLIPYDKYYLENKAIEKINELVDVVNTLIKKEKND